ncbi:unnamed protein product, partial [Prorocentrum cordatum]
EVSAAYSCWPDIQFITGTRLRRRATDGECTSIMDEHCHILNWGWSTAPFSGARCGVQIRMLKRRFCLRHIAAVCSPPSSIQGRVGGVMLRSGRFHLACFVVYLPPRPSVARKFSAYQRTIKEILAWLNKTCSELPARASIVFGGDINDYAGIWMANTIVQDPSPVGPVYPAQEHNAMTQLRDFMDQYNLCLLSTFMGGQNTFYGNNANTRIDYLGGPRS